MTVPQIILSDSADASGLGLGWYDRPVDWDGEYATYLPGIDQPNAPGWDYSLNGRDTSPEGVTFGSGWFNGGWIDTPVAPRDLGDAFTVWALVKTHSTSGSPVAETFLGSSGGTNQRFVDLVIDPAAGGAYKMLISTGSGVGFIGSPSLPLNVGTGAGWDLLVGCVQPNGCSLHRRSITASADVAAAIDATGVYGPVPWTIGNNHDHTVVTPANLAIAGAGLIVGILSNAQIDLLYARLKAHFATIGLAI